MDVDAERYPPGIVILMMHLCILRPFRYLRILQDRMERSS